MIEGTAEEMVMQMRVVKKETRKVMMRARRRCSWADAAVAAA